MSEFALIYRQGGAELSPEQMQQHFQACLDWFQDLSAKGLIRDPGVPLKPGGSTVVGTDRIVRDGPFAEAKDLISGFTLLEVRDLNEAIEVAKTCPIADIGGTIEVRPVGLVGACSSS